MIDLFSATKEEIEKEYGKVWTIEEFLEEFEIEWVDWFTCGGKKFRWGKNVCRIYC